MCVTANRLTSALAWSLRLVQSLILAYMLLALLGASHHSFFSLGGAEKMRI